MKKLWVGILINRVVVGWLNFRFPAAVGRCGYPDYPQGLEPWCNLCKCKPGLKGSCPTCHPFPHPHHSFPPQSALCSSSLGHALTQKSDVVQVKPKPGSSRRYFKTFSESALRLKRLCSESVGNAGMTSRQRPTCSAHVSTYQGKRCFNCVFSAALFDWKTKQCESIG